MITLAQSRYPQLSFKVGNVLERKTLPRKKYAGFWAVAILQHIPLKDWSTALGNIEHITKPGAIGYITVPSTRPSRFSKTDKRHFELFTKESFKRTIRSHNWKILNSGLLHSRGTVWYWFIVKLPG